MAPSAASASLAASAPPPPAVLPVAVQGRLAFADAIRGLAALWVVLFHVAAGHHIPALQAQLAPPVMALLFEHGHLGVPVFFVLSGFVMALNLAGRDVGGRAALQFLGRRLVRLSPPYYAAIGLALAYLLLQFLVQGEEAPQWPGTGSLLAHLLYLQGFLSIPDINPVLWTLCVEVQFYIAFAGLACVCHRWLGGEAALVWLLFASALAGLAWPLGWIDVPPWPGSFLPYWYCFAIGALTYLGWRRGGSALRLALLALALLWAVAGWRASGYPLVSALTGSLLLAAGLGRYMNRWLNWRALQWLGGVSYSLYLIHNLVIGAGFFVLRRGVPQGLGGELLALALVLAACLLASWLMVRWIERPSIRWSHRVRLQA